MERLFVINKYKINRTPNKRKQQKTRNKIQKKNKENNKLIPI